MTKRTIAFSETGWPMMKPLPEKEAQIAQQSMTEGEQQVGWMLGLHDQLALATDRRLLIVKTGWLVGSAFGHKSTSFDYRNLTAVEIRSTMAFGFFEVSAGGMSLPNAPKGRQKQQEMPNIVTFAKADGKHWERFAGKVREMAGSPGAPQVGAPAPDLTDQIRKLADLRDAGVLTEEEFAAKKADLLARM